MKPFRLILATALVALLAAPPAWAKTFRWANDGDVSSMDPYARNETFLLMFVGNIYEPLVRRDRELKLEPALALSWSNPAPDVWRFNLRPGVKFSDGTPFTADDVLFSYERAKGPGSFVGNKLATVKTARKIDDLTVEFVTDGPDPILAEEITDWYIVSKAWAEKNNATRAADLTKREENFATRNAMGTGPFVLAAREPDQRTVLRPNPGWWDKPQHNLTEVEFLVIANPATRIAALLSGQVDMVYTVPPQDVDRISRSAGFKVLQGPELRTIYLGLDQWRDELLKSNVKGKNPFKDVRVRRAVYHAIDAEAIKTRVMRGQSTPTALMVAPGINGFDPKLNVRLPHDPALAKRLMTEAGYGDGFTVTMDCPNDRYVNDEAICLAIAAMLARIDVKVDVNAQTRTKFFTEILGPGYNTSFFLYGSTPPTYDAHYLLYHVVNTRNVPKGAGTVNISGYANARVDELIRLMQSETDAAKRQAMVSEAMKLHHDEVGHVPLHQQVLIWALREGIDLAQPPDNYLPLRYATVK